MTKAPLPAGGGEGRTGSGARCRALPDVSHQCGRTGGESEGRRHTAGPPGRHQPYTPQSTPTKQAVTSAFHPATACASHAADGTIRHV